MKSRLYLLLASSLLLTGLGAVSCAKKDDPQAPMSSASYTLDGKARTCTVAQAATPGQDYDRLTITLTTTPQPSSGPEVLSLNLRKPTGQPAAAYEYMPVGSILLDSSVSLTPYDFNQRSSPLPTFASTSISGTVDGKMVAFSSPGTYQVLHTIQDGKFTLILP